MLNALAMLNPESLMIILAVILVLFGGSKIPQLMRGIGQGVGELKKGMEDGHRTFTEATKYEPPPPEKKPDPQPEVKPEPEENTSSSTKS